MKNINCFNLNESLRSEVEFAVSTRRLPHAILISSGDYQSRVDFALYLSASYLCENESNVRPCGECKNCRKIFDYIHPDVKLFEREKDKKEFSVKIIRDFIKPDAYIKPNEANGKVFIIKDAETMNVSAQNALLKIFEEPPKGVIFILCSDSSTALLETIRSRATVYSLQSDLKKSEDEIKAEELSVDFAVSLLSVNEFEFLSKTSLFEKDKQLFCSVIGKMQILFRDALAVKNGSSSLSTDNDVSIRLASGLGTRNLINLINICNEFNDSINKNANLNLLLTRFSSVLRQAARG